MKTIIPCIAIAIIIAACNNSNDSADGKNKSPDSTAANTPVNNSSQAQPASVNETIAAYLQLKNALVADDSKAAASAGNQLHQSIQKLSRASFSVEQKNVFEDVQEDLTEHAEHIGENAGNITHQREHFDMLSRDIYDLVKVMKPGQVLYHAHCPMYNDKKGAMWLSEIKEIKNPYYGKEMLTCGNVKEVIEP